MSDGHQTPDNAAPTEAAQDGGIPPAEAEPSKKPAMLRTAFDDGALKVMEDEFQV